MYGLDKNKDLTFLEGKELIQICIGQHQVILRYTDDVYISIEGNFELLSQDESGYERTLPELASSLVVLLGAKVSETEIGDNGALDLHFSNHEILRLYDSNDNSESYEIGSPNFTIVV